MYRFLREQDRELNKDSYPKLNYPEVYVMEGGYKAFYEKFEVIDVFFPDYTRLNSIKKSIESRMETINITFNNYGNVRIAKNKK